MVSRTIWMVVTVIWDRRRRCEEVMQTGYTPPANGSRRHANGVQPPANGSPRQCKRVREPCKRGTDPCMQGSNVVQTAPPAMQTGYRPMQTGYRPMRKSSAARRTGMRTLRSRSMQPSRGAMPPGNGNHSHQRHSAPAWLRTDHSVKASSLSVASSSATVLRCALRLL